MATAPDLARRLAALPAAAPLVPVLAGDRGVWVVGGAVRDLLLGGRPLDLDLVVEGDAAAVVRRLAEALPDPVRVSVHDRFGTATVRCGEHAYDVVRARAESYARPGALPDVRPGTLDEDLARRDFTANAIALAFDGRLASVPHALEDLEARVLRITHDASFRDDPTRLLRLVRYATRLGFGVEQRTAALADEAVAAGALATVTGTRLGRELRLLLREPGAVEGLARLADWGMGRGEAGAVVTGLHVDRELMARTVGLLPSDGRRDLLLLAAAALRVAPDALAERLDELGFAARERDTVVGAARGAKRAGERLAAAARPSEIAAALRGASPELAALAGALGGPAAAEAARRWLAELRHVRLEIDGDDLIAAGVPRGAGIGTGLRAALGAALDGAAADRDAQLAAALAAAREG